MTASGYDPLSYFSFTNVLEVKVSGGYRALFII